ncbi:MAG: family transcriptional regulator, cyclic receptor protein [Chloroflexota bacterium]|jgi:CRP-like cAMP-binding protein|nr:family transcriptional regulator, cyclic receptor protein [Chloroflexota bacterium]
MVRVRRGATFFQTDPSAEWMFLLNSGRVRLSRYTLGGRKLQLDLLEPPAWFVGARLARGVGEALVDSEIQVLSRQQTGEVIRQRPEIGLGMLELIGNRLVDSEDRLEYLAYHSVSSRIALALLRLRRDEDGVIEGITHQELGDMVGAHRETVTKLLGSLQGGGYIEVRHRCIKVANPVGLAELLEG